MYSLRYVTSSLDGGLDGSLDLKVFDFQNLSKEKWHTLSEKTTWQLYNFLLYNYITLLLQKS